MRPGSKTSAAPEKTAASELLRAGLAAAERPTTVKPAERRELTTLANR